MSGTRRKAGRLRPQVEGYRAWLGQRGYSTTPPRNMLKELGRVGRWLTTQGLDAAQLNEDRVEDRPKMGVLFEVLAFTGHAARERWRCDGTT